MTPETVSLQYLELKRCRGRRERAGHRRGPAQVLRPGGARALRGPGAAHGASTSSSSPARTTRRRRRKPSRLAARAKAGEDFAQARAARIPTIRARRARAATSAGPRGKRTCSRLRMRCSPCRRARSAARSRRSSATTSSGSRTSSLRTSEDSTRCAPNSRPITASDQAQNGVLREVAAAGGRVVRVAERTRQRRQETRPARCRRVEGYTRQGGGPFGAGPQGDRCGVQRRRAAAAPEQPGDQRRRRQRGRGARHRSQDVRSSVRSRTCSPRVEAKLRDEAARTAAVAGGQAAAAQDRRGRGVRRRPPARV